MSKRTIFLFVVFVLLVLGLVCYLFVFNPPKPIKILTPDSYPKGTTVSLYSVVPAGFPSGVVLEASLPTHSDVVSSPDGKKQMTVVYKSSLSITELLANYTNSLSKNNWNVAISKIYNKDLAVIEAVKNTNTLIITFTSSVSKSGPSSTTSITFQYQQK